MSKLGLKYQIVFTNCELDQSNNYQPIPQTVTIDIYDRTNIIDDAAEVTIIPLTAAGDPLHIVSIDNSEDKFTPIRAQQAIIKFESDENFDLSIFTDTIYFTTPVGDPRYYVEIYIRSMFIFKGFLAFDDCSEAFMPTPNIVTLTATDGLGWLKNINLSLLVTNPSGFYRIIDFLAGALANTGLSLPINCIFNIRELNNPANHLFDKVWLWDKTFKKDPDNYEDSYSVISKILGEEGYLTQWNGEWWIVRPDEFESIITYRSIFNADGSFNSAKAGTSLFQQFINKDTGTIFFSEEATEVIPQSEYKWVKETYNLDSVGDIPCNGEMNRGAFRADLPDEVIDSVTYNVKSYNWDCWTYIKLNAVQDSDAYVRKYYLYGVEKQRFARCEATAVNTTYYWRLDDRIPLDLKDKFRFNFSYRYTSDLGGGTGHFELACVWLRLYGNDGTFWNLHYHFGENIPDVNKGNYWVQSNASWSVNTEIVEQEGQLENIDFLEWQSVDFEAAPAPVAGNLEILLMNANSPQNQKKDFSSIGFEYIPLIGGNYKTFTSLSDKAYQAVGYRAKREKRVYMSDGIKKLFKGAMHRYNGTDYVMVDRFFNWAAVQSTTPAFADIHSYLHIQTYDVWNQYRNVMRIFHATAQGLQSNLTTSLDKNFIPYPSPIFHMILQDSSRHTNDKIFAMLTWDLDFYTCEWKGTVAEVFNAIRGKRYDDPEEIKYNQ